MKKIGIVGGTAWLSTVDYYTAICRMSEQFHAAQNRKGPLPTPEMSIESLDLKKAVSYIGTQEDEGSWRLFDAYHRDALRRLEANGVDVAIMASNTPHHRFEAITRGIGIPVISIFEAVAKECARIGIERLLIVGTALTMDARTMCEVFATYGVDAFTPRTDEEKASVIAVIADVQCGMLHGAAERINNIAKTSFGRESQGRPVVCLACTELPCAFPAMKGCSTFEDDDILYINTLAIHAKAAFDSAVAP